MVQSIKSEDLEVSKATNPSLNRWVLMRATTRLYASPKTLAVFSTSCPCLRSHAFKTFWKLNHMPRIWRFIKNLIYYWFKTDSVKKLVIVNCHSIGKISLHNIVESSKNFYCLREVGSSCSRTCSLADKHEVENLGIKMFQPNAVWPTHPPNERGGGISNFRACDCFKSLWGHTQ